LAYCFQGTRNSGGVHFSQLQNSSSQNLADLTIAREQEKAEKLTRENPGQNETFAFIAGYTSGGAPYGITWEEWEQLEPGSSKSNTWLGASRFCFDNLQKIIKTPGGSNK
jgi:hypothetical protein